MSAGTAEQWPAGSLPDWIEVIEGDAPIVLLAPHGGRAGTEAAALTLPRINDLHTAEIARDLAARLGASAIINTAMDRNRLDCNRLTQVVAGAPSMLTALAEKLESCLARHQRAVVLAIHGWNLVEPRVDIGVGLCERDGILRPVRGAFVSVSEQFLNGALATLAGRLGRAGIAATFGMRYPAGAAQNLVQALTGRHRENHFAILRRLAALADNGAIEAAQLELSMALRISGSFREAAIQTLVEVLGDQDGDLARDGRRIIQRSAIPRPPARKAAHDTRNARLGIEFYDPVRRIGIVASFDAGYSAGGGRLMILLPSGAISLYTADGRAGRQNGRIRAGALIAERIGTALHLRFRGPALITPSDVAYTDIERALARSALEETAELSLEIKNSAAIDPGSTLEELGKAAGGFFNSLFGGACGHLSLGRLDYQLGGVSRIGAAITAPGPAGLVERRMAWACLAPESKLCAVELEDFLNNRGQQRTGHLFENNKLAPVSFGFLEPASLTQKTFGVAIWSSDGRELRLEGQVDGSISLMRSLGSSRFHTRLAFAAFVLDGSAGAGIFETTRRIGSGCALGNISVSGDPPKTAS
ncbi:MAG: hypothetical protein ACREP6_00665 [Candidatus Binataceae bacterium]